MSDIKENLPAGLFITKEGYWRGLLTINGSKLYKRFGNTNKVTKDQAIKEFNKFRHNMGKRPYKNRSPVIPVYFRDVSEGWEESILALKTNEINWLTTIFSKAKQRSKKKKREFILTFDELKELAINTRGRCTLTNIQFSEVNPNNSRVRPFVPSLDRIDSSAGYSKDNCRLICAALNLALMDFGESVFNQLAVGHVTTKLMENNL
jgi:hypothetical protein